MKIEFNKNELYEQLHKLSAQLGLKLQAPELISSVTDDEERIEPLWQAAVVELARCLAPYVIFSIEDDKVEYTLDLPDNWDCEWSSSLSMHCRQFLVNALFARWLYFVSPETANIYKTMNIECAQAVTEILAKRAKPQISKEE